MAYIIFHYSRLDSWIRASDEPYITGSIVSVYDDGKIITENENSLEQKVNKKIICEDLYVTNRISKIIDDNKVKIRAIPKNLDLGVLDGSCDSVWLKNRHFHGVCFLSQERLSRKEYKEWKKYKKGYNLWTKIKYKRRLKGIYKFRDIYEQIREILVSVGMPKDFMV